VRHKLIKLLKLFVSFSDEGEDKLLLQVFMDRGLRKGTYLDIGAYHPFKVSNTFLLYLWGWSGTCVDIRKKWLFKLLRPRDKFIYGYVEAKESYYFHRKLFTSDFTIAKGLIKKGNEYSYQEVPFIAAETFKGMDIDLLDLDIDGLDEMVLRKLLDNISPRFILVEDHCLPEQMGIQKYLESKSYKRIAGTTRNGLYERVENDLANNRSH
jgi:hypothetical protein